MGKIDSELMEGEDVYFRTSLHWVTLLVPAGVVGLSLPFLLSGLVLMRQTNGLSLMFLVLAPGLPLAWLYLAILKRRTSEFAVTNKRVMIQVGIVRSRSVDLLLDKVESVAVDQGAIARMFGYGTVAITGTGGSRDVFYGIEGPVEFRRQVQERASK